MQGAQMCAEASLKGGRKWRGIRTDTASRWLAVLLVLLFPAVGSSGGEEREQAAPFDFPKVRHPATEASRGTSWGSSAEFHGGSATLRPVLTPPRQVQDLCHRAGLAASHKDYALSAALYEDAVALMGRVVNVRVQERLGDALAHTHAMQRAMDSYARALSVPPEHSGTLAPPTPQQPLRRRRPPPPTLRAQVPAQGSRPPSTSSSQPRPRTPRGSRGAARTRWRRWRGWRLRRAVLPRTAGQLPCVARAAARPEPK